MTADLRDAGKGNLFVIFGEPDIDILPADGGQTKVKVKINGVDVFHPNTGEARGDGLDGIACWFIDAGRDRRRRRGHLAQRHRPALRQAEVRPER